MQSSTVKTSELSRKKQVLRRGTILIIKDNVMMKMRNHHWIWQFGVQQHSLHEMLDMLIGEKIGGADLDYDPDADFIDNNPLALQDSELLHRDQWLELLQHRATRKTTLLR